MPILKYLLTLLTLFCCTTLFAQDLDTYQWTNRIILLKEPNLDSDWLQAQIKRLQSDMGELNERQLMVFIISNDFVYDIDQNKTHLEAKKINEQFGIANFQGLALIGKDGGIKLKEAFIVNPKKIFELIDSMPMRKEEMKNK